MYMPRFMLQENDRIFDVIVCWMTISPVLLEQAYAAFLINTVNKQKKKKE
jgi:hypothetical protein